jgi:hypothetical protein
LFLRRLLKCHLNGETKRLESNIFVQICVNVIDSLGLHNSLYRRSFEVICQSCRLTNRMCCTIVVEVVFDYLRTFSVLGIRLPRLFTPRV